jgi:pimeloyl-ACP methyl ester carboxylesterase
MFKGFIWTTALVLLIAILIAVYQQYSSIKTSDKITQWAEENRIVIDKSKVKPTSFKIEYDENEWNLLKKKLELTRYFEPLDEKYVKKFEFGFDPEYAKVLVDYWKTNFNWSKQVDYINRFPQYRIKINDITIHYVHIITNKDKLNNNIKSIPILLMDGWPGSFFGFYKMIDYINDNYKDISYNIIVPSIPGYGYSIPLNRPFDYIDTAQYFDALMRLIHGDNVQYYAHGEDWGAFVATTLAQFYPDRVKGIHLTMSGPPPKNDLTNIFYQLTGVFFPGLIYTPEELKHNVPDRASIKSLIMTILKEMGYFHIQATKPDTVALGLTDSPSGLLSYILEKYSGWTFDFDTQIAGKRDGGLDKFNKDELLTIISLYWFTNTISSSVRYYKGMT